MTSEAIGKAMKYRWLIFTILALCYVLVYFHRLCPAVLAVDIMHDLKASGAITGFLAAAYFTNMRNVYKPHTLPSGKVIKLIGVNKWMEVGEENSLVLQYQTDINLDSKDALKAEAEEIWEYFQVNANNASVSKARILAYSPREGRFIKKSSGYGFLITKQPDGTWAFSEEKESQRTE